MLDSIINRKIYHTHTIGNGGFFLYLKLTIYLWINIFKYRKEFIQVENKKWDYFIIIITSFLKTPYWLFIKPFLFFFSVKKVYKGSYTLENGNLNKKHSVNKRVIYRFLNIPFFFYFGRPNAKEWSYLLNQYQ